MHHPAAAKGHTRPILADDGAERRFRRQGYVAAPMLQPDAVAALLAEIGQLRPHDSFAPDGSSFARNDYHCTFLDDDLDYRRQVQSLLARYFDPVVARLVPDFRILTANLYVKQPGKGDFPIHQNWPVLADLGATSVTLWCALVDCDAEMGTLHAVPGSHKLLPHVEGPNSPAYFTPLMADMAKYLVALPAQAGHGYVFDDSLVHGSPPNRSERSRIAVQLACIPRASQPVFFYRNGEDRFELIEADTEFYYRHRVSDLLERSPAWNGLGHLANRNRLIDEPEFVRLVKEAAKSRCSQTDGEGVSSGPRPDSGRIARVKAALRNVLGSFRIFRSAGSRAVPGSSGEERGPRMFSHIVIGANDVAISRRFYDAVLGTLGIPPARTDENGRAIYMHNGGYFMLTKPIDGEPACAANGGTIGFVADAPEAVEAWHSAGLANGGTSIEDPPGWREGDYGRYYLAYLRDPAGNKICAMHRGS